MSAIYDCLDPSVRPTGIAAATRAVKSGELIVLPTDTVYGIGADAFDRAAVASLLAAKGRGRDMPVPVLVGSWTTLDGLMMFVPDRVRELVEHFWPGALTLIVEQAPSLSWDLGDARGTVAVRMPMHPIALELLGQTGPMAVSSANRSGHPPASSQEQAYDQLGSSVSVYLDGGPSGEPVPSTIIDVTGETAEVLRLGALSLEELRDVLPDLKLPENS